MSERDDDGEAEKRRALATTAAGGEARSPSAQALHDGVKQMLFDGRSRAPTEYEAGTMLAGRYHVVALLGRGGMGEVYRARDRVVDEDVAIKFLPARLADRPAYLERFVQEVRVARQVSHPHVCRVHDIGEADGRRFISMEYIDGEDLASLLHRIGRLGHEKALELAHQLCAGLAALHERGIIHRDLKPSNVMLDGKGRIRIADFGLASVADELREHEIRDGTPAYQAPEQIAGREATARSDVYALGLVLHEMFLGRRPGDSTPNMSTAMSGLDTAVAEVVERCLDPDPRHRPASALEVAAALPGGDPLSAALAAGRLPSPEAIANAPTVGALSRRVAALLVAATLFALFAIGIFAVANTAIANDGDLLEPAVLEHRVAEVLRTAGYDPDFRGGHVVHLAYDESLVERIVYERDDPRQALRDSEASAIEMHYRGFPQIHPTESTIRAAVVALDSPLQTEVVVDGHGRLRELLRIPPVDLYAADGGTTGGDEEEDRELVKISRSVDVPPPPEPTPLRTYPWRRLLDEAGLDGDTLDEITPSRRPPVYADTLRAWRGELGDVDVTVHAASASGRPVWFVVEREAFRPPTIISEGIVVLVIGALVAGIAVLVATLRNALAVLRRREGDFLGARRLAYATFTLQASSWILNAQAFEWLDISAWLLLSAGTGVAAWLGYLILEPYARANWPRSLVSWTRVMQGRWRDPMVGRDMLVAACVAAGLAFAMPLVTWLVGDDPLIANYDLDALLGVRRAVGVVANDTRDAVAIALGIYVVLLALQAVVRLRIVALCLFVGSVPAAMIAGGAVPLGFATAIMLLVQAMVMVRFGLLALVVLNILFACAMHLPITLNFSAWWAPTGLLGVAIVLVPTIVGWVHATAPSRHVARATTSSSRR